MATRDAYLPGVPCWIDLRQPDPEAARAFYGGLFGWSYSDDPYSIASLDGRAVAAIAPGEGPDWNMYVAVERIEDAAAKIEAAGGPPPRPPPGGGGGRGAGPAGAA